MKEAKVTNFEIHHHEGNNFIIGLELNGDGSVVWGVVTPEQLRSMQTKIQNRLTSHQIQQTFKA